MISSRILANIFKLLWKLLLIAVVCAGVYCAVMLIDHYNNKSETFGTVNYHDIYADFNVFDCDLSDAIFYKTDTGYEYEITVPKAVEFDGNKNKYNVLINDMPCTNETSTAGILTATHNINYYTLEGNNNLQIQLDVTLKFYQSKVEIVISNTNNILQQSYFLEYLQFNGLNLRIIDAQYTPTQDIVITTCTATFLDAENNCIEIQQYRKGASIVAPEAPAKSGYVFAGWSPEIPEIITSNMIFTATYEQLEENVVGYVEQLNYANTVYASFVDANFSVNSENISKIVLNGSITFLDGNTAYFDNTEIEYKSAGYSDGLTRNTSVIDVACTNSDNTVTTQKLYLYLTKSGANINVYFFKADADELSGIGISAVSSNTSITYFVKE